MPQIDIRTQLLEELERDWNDYFSAGRLNNILDLALSILSVLASLAATVLLTAGAGTLSRWIIAAVAAVPAGSTSLQRIVGTRERSNWYFSHAAQVSALKTELQYATAPDIEDFARKRALIEVAMESQWSRIGPAGKPASGRRR